MKVNTTKMPDSTVNVSGWVEAVYLTGHYLSRPTRADSLLAPVRGRLGAHEYALCQQLFYGVLRNLSLLNAGVDSLCPRKPITGAAALVMVAGYELLEDGADAGKRAVITHHAVEMARKILPARMRGFVNAVLRHLPEKLVELQAAAVDPVDKLALANSHPAWLVRRWMGEFGPESTEALLKWDQQVPPVCLRLEAGVEAPPCLKPTQWPGYFSYEGGGWYAVENLLNARKAYAQDPATRLCVELLDPRPTESVLDLCAAPGGKARHILPRMAGQGTLACVDLPGVRSERLRENLAGEHGGLRVEVVESDVFELNEDLFKARNLPALYNAVLLDAPCSNTGVLRRRPDARWRLSEGDIEKAAALQTKLLEKAAMFVAPGGRLVYSTCSIEAAENADVVAAFLAAHPEFKAGASKLAFPWADGHDGAGAFVLLKPE
jgi:16S rRNA (cytosine967-C5)-methyltransferase